MIRTLLVAATMAPVDPQPSTDPRPAVDDPTVAQMRPTGRRVALLTVAQDGTGDYTTIGGATAAAKQTQRATAQAEGLNPEALTPNYRADILIKPGHYVENVWVNPQQAFYATDPKRGATILESTNPGPWQGGTIGPGGCTYWEGVDLIAHDSDDDDPKYPIHLSNHGTNIFARCSLDNRNLGGLGYPTTIGTDGAPYGTVVLYDVDLVSGGTNQHGWAHQPEPQTIIYAKVRSPQGRLDYRDMGGGDPTEVWVVDCDGQGVLTIGSNTRLHVARSTYGALDYGGTLDDRDDWPIPVGGLSARDRAHYGM